MVPTGCPSSVLLEVYCRTVPRPPNSGRPMAVQKCAHWSSAGTCGVLLITLDDRFVLVLKRHPLDVQYKPVIKRKSLDDRYKLVIKILLLDDQYRPVIERLPLNVWYKPVIERLPLNVWFVNQSSKDFLLMIGTNRSSRGKLLTNGSIIKRFPLDERYRPVIKRNSLEDS
jgi:hypothetical protein